MMKSWLTIFAFFAVLTSCSAPQEETAFSERPARVVSLDFCADQYALKLLDKDRILALSPDAEKNFSYMRDKAKGIRKTRALAEDVMILKPDLVIRSYGGGPNAAAYFEKLGIPVVQLGYAHNIEAIKAVMRDAAIGLGEEARGEAVVAEMDRRITALIPRIGEPKSLYMTPGGVTTGPGSLVDEMLSAAGLQNFETEPGWRALPLERLVREQPDLVAAAFYENAAQTLNLWTPSNHPIAQKLMRDVETVMLDGAWTSCGGWYLLDAIETLAGSSQYHPEAD